MSKSSAAGKTGNTGPKKLNVHNFPRPPLLEPTPRRLQIKWNDATVADTTAAYWALETTHPPTYYLPVESLDRNLVDLKVVPGRSSLCEWKGRATYHDLIWKGNGDRGSGGGGGSGNDNVVRGKIWSYEAPTPGFVPIKGYLSFYANDVPWECFVDGEKVVSQPGNFYGGWITSDLEGPFKGGPGTWGW